MEYFEAGKLHRENSEIFHPPVGDDEDETEDEEMHNGVLSKAEYRLKTERTVVKNAIKSRFFVFFVNFISSGSVGPFDSSTALFIDNVPQFLQCPANWDGAYYIRIANHGYEYEEVHAFFPLLPFISRLVSRTFILNWFTTNEYLASAFAAVIVNNMAFVATAVVLFRLGSIVLGSDRWALRAALLFCWNPASIFFSVAYSESLFAFLSFSGMLTLARSTSFRSRYMATLFFSLATLARSNGAVLGLYSLWAAYQAYQMDTRTSTRAYRAVFELALVGGTHFLALLTVLGYGWARFCYFVPVGAANESWCNNLIPNIYSYVQDKYWNVGLFRYYEKKQIPNFILAAPAFILSCEGFKIFLTRRSLPLPYLVHLVLSILVGALVMHVQVFTRFIASSSPVFFWYAAEVTMRKSALSYLVYMYFAFYCIFGTAMFCNYFPWT